MSVFGYDEFTFDLPASALTDFSLMLDLSLCSTDWWAAVDTSDGTKGRCFKQDGTRLAVDWIDFDDTGETGFARILWSGTLPTSGTISLQIEPPNTGNASVAASDTYGQYAAYDSSWSAYLPLYETPSGGTMYNRTSGSNNGTVTDANGSLGTTSGKLGTALDVPSTGDIIDLGTNVYSSAQGTIQAWMQLDDASTYYGVLGTRTSDSDEFSLVTVSPGTLAGTSWTNRVQGGSIGTGWHMVTATLDSGGRELFIDGVSIGSNSAVNFSTFTAHTRILSRGDASFYFKGAIQHCQFHSGVRSSDWIAYEYDQTNDPATFWGSATWVPDQNPSWPLRSFAGNTDAIVTAIDVSGGIVTPRTTAEVPFFFHASGSAVTYTASGNVSTAYRDLEFRWTLEREDGAGGWEAITDTEGITYPWDGSAYNRYTEQVGPEAFFVVRDEHLRGGAQTDFRLTMTCRGWNGSSFVTASTTETFTADPFSGTTYYIDPTSGDNGNDGLTTSTPKQTITGLLAADTRVLYKRGETASITARTSFPASSNMRIGAYGSGAKPILSIDASMTTVFYFNVNNGDYYQDVVFSDLEFQLGTNAPSAVSVDGGASTGYGWRDIYIDGCDIYGGLQQVRFYKNGGDYQERCGAYNCNLLEATDAQSITTLDDIDWIAFVAGTLTGEGSNASLNHHAYVKVGEHTLFESYSFGEAYDRNYCINFDRPVDTSTDHGFLVCRFNDFNGRGGCLRGVDISNNSNSASYGNITNAVVYRNVFRNFKNDAIFWYNAEAAVRDNAFFANANKLFSPNVASLDEFTCNLIHADTTVDLIGFNSSNTNTNYFKHNVIYSDATAGILVEADSGTFVGGINENHYYAPNDSDGDIFTDASGPTNYTFSEWQGLGFDANSTNGVDPGFADPANGDFTGYTWPAAADPVSAFPGTAYQDTLDDATLEDYLPFDDNAASTTYTNSGNSGRTYDAYTGNSEDYHVAAAGTEPFYDWLPGGSFLNSSTARWVGCDLTSTGTYTALTACAWFKSSDADGSIYNFWSGSSQRAFLDLDTDGTLDAYVTDGTNIKRRKYASSLADGQWHFAGLVWDAATDDLLLFLDGEFVTPASSPNDDTIASVSAYGRHSWGGRLDSDTTKRLDANLVGARRYSSAQTLEQMQAMYYGPTWAPTNSGGGGAIPPSIAGAYVNLLAHHVLGS